MLYHEEQSFADERDWQAQQKVDEEALQQQLIEIIRASEWRQLSGDERLQLYIGCGIDRLLFR